jgi:hypothetical protein
MRVRGGGGSSVVGRRSSVVGRRSSVVGHCASDPIVVIPRRNDEGSALVVRTQPKCRFLAEFTLNDANGLGMTAGGRSGVTGYGHDRRPTTDDRRPTTDSAVPVTT